MYNAQNAQKTIIELRNAMSTLRSTASADINFELLEMILSHGLVDLSLAIELIDHLAKENEELRHPTQDQDVQPEGSDN